MVNTSWSPPHNVSEMSFVQFLHEMDELESAGNGTKIYLQVKPRLGLGHMHVK